MNPDGRKPDLHPIDGRLMTVQEIADMIGRSKKALQILRSREGRCSYQLIVDMWRRNEIGGPKDRHPRHLVHGRWVTMPQVAEELGRDRHTLSNYRCANRRHDGTWPTLEEVYDHFKGLQRQRPGPKPKKHRVLGHRLTIAEAAEKYRTTEVNLRTYMAKHHCKLETAVRRLEERRAKQAEKDIMRILGF